MSKLHTEGHCFIVFNPHVRVVDADAVFRCSSRRDLHDDCFESLLHGIVGDGEVNIYAIGAIGYHYRSGKRGEIDTIGGGARHGVVDRECTSGDSTEIFVASVEPDFSVGRSFFG